LSPILSIDDPEDPRIAVFREVRERDVAGRHGGFIAEGEVVLRVLSRSRLHRPVSVRIAEKRIQSLRPILEAFDESVAIYSATQGVMDAIAGFPIHRGILAFGRRAPEVSADDLLKDIAGDAIILALFGVANHDNMGGLFRNAAAFGADAVLLDATSCDPLYRKAIRVSVGAALKVPFARLAAGEDALALLAEAGFTALALSPAGAEPLAGLVRPARAAVLLGAEGPGLPDLVMSGARTVAIAMAPGWDSLNVAAASAVMLHELTLGVGRSGA